ncbi:MAG TPA: hypothetical protein VGR62_18475 [Candidatus Binatia bacterium]|nr:hypothetical protein [Candidatus Binatia bacterium]
MTYGAKMHPLRVALALVVLHAVMASGAELECPAVKGSAAPGTVVARTNFGSGIYDLGRSDRICRPKDGLGLGALRSHPVRGAKPATNLARVRVGVSLIEGQIDVDTSTPIAILLPENPGQPAYACYRLLPELPPARLCLLADIDGKGLPTGKLLLCNRGRCREREQTGLLSPGVDPYQSASDATVSLPGATSAIDAVMRTERGRVGRLTMDVILDLHSVIELQVALRTKGRWGLTGSVVTDGIPVTEISGLGRTRHILATKTLSLDADLSDSRGTTTIGMTHVDEPNPNPNNFSLCWLLSMDGDDGLQTTITFPLVVPPTGLGASRTTTEITTEGETRATLANGDCSVTPSGRLACVIPATTTTGAVSYDLRLLGTLQVGGPSGGTFIERETRRAGSWTARTTTPLSLTCPAS